MATSQKRLFNDIFTNVNSGSASLTPGALTANVVNTANTVTVPGAALGDFVLVSVPAAIGATIVSGEVTAANTVTLKFLSNAVTAPPAGVYTVVTMPLDPKMSL